MSNAGKQLSNPYSTGGGGIHFENRVQASFVVLMLTGGFSPCLPTWPIRKIKLQGKYQNYNTDDLIIYAKQSEGDRLAKLLGQIKHSIKITKGDKVFGEVIQAAWSDFNNKEIFSEDTDALALITGPLSSTDTDHVRALLKQAEHSINAEDFIKRVTLGNFTSNGQREKLDAFRTHLKTANDDVGLTDDQLWRFLKSFHLLIYDLDIKGIILSLLHTLIGQYSQDRAADLLALIEQEIAYKSENAGYITFNSLPDNIHSAFQRPVTKTIPDDLVITALPNVEPVWNHQAYALPLVFANLLGSWNEQSDADKEIVARLTGEEFSVWISKIREILQQPESPITLKNGVWSVTNRELLWRELGPRIFDDNLDIFKQCAVAILSESDPMFILPSDQRFAASIYGNVLKYSKSVRKGITESLALLGSHPGALTNCSLNKSETIAILTVRKIFENADWVLWGSLNDLLPLFAEAAPNELLNAIENALQNTPCPFDELFAQEGSGLSGGNYLTGLLWALETLAWDEQFLVRVTVILGELASRDPGGNWANRPSNSLATIFLPWHPQTTASIVKRKVAVQTLLKEIPEVGWKLLLKMLPNQRQTSSGSHKPIWGKTIPDDLVKGVTRQEYWDQVSIYADMSVEMAHTDLGMLTELVNYLDHLPPPSFEKVVAHLSSAELLGKPENERIDLWTELTKFALRHKRYSEAKWALSPDQVVKIEEVAEALAPVNPLNLNRMLFSNRNSDLFEDIGNWQQQQQQLEERRQQAIKKIFDYSGTTGTLQFATTVESPSSVGYSLGFIGETAIDSAILPEFLNTSDKNLTQFASAFIWGRYCCQGWVWVDNISFAGWTRDQIGQFLAWLPFTEETWNRVNELLGDSEAQYWAKTNVNPYQTDRSLGLAIDKLIEYGRPNAAIECLYKTLHDKQPLEKTRTVQALLAAVKSTEPSYSLNSYHIVELIKALQDALDTNPDDLFHVEWAYLPLLDSHNGASPKLLENRLASDSSFFCEVIRLVYRSKMNLIPDTEPTEHQKAIATNAYRLLDEWRKPPGMKMDGKFSGEDFSKWLELTKSSCTESGHLEVALTHVGSVLVYCPSDPEGLWIDQAAAKALNSKDAENMRNGFSQEVFNSRGVHWVDPTGNSERELAVKYRLQAEDVENAGYQRFAATLRGLAESYDRDAERIIADHKQEDTD